MTVNRNHMDVYSLHIGWKSDFKVAHKGDITYTPCKLDDFQLVRQAQRESHRAHIAAKKLQKPQNSR